MVRTRENVGQGHTMQNVIRGRKLKKIEPTKFAICAVPIKLFAACITDVPRETKDNAYVKFRTGRGGQRRYIMGHGKCASGE